MTTKKIILAHDSFTQLGGAERVVMGLAEIFPTSPIYVLVAKKEILDRLPVSISSRVKTTPLQYLYNIYPKFQHLLPFIPVTLFFTKIPTCDILLSSSSAFAKGFRKPKDAKHINYCHTPTRFLWTDENYFYQEVPMIVRLPAKIFLWWLKKWDLKIARSVDIFLANSKEVQKRIKQFYKRDSEVVYPFIDSSQWQSGNPQILDGKYFLIAGRLHAHKQNDMVVQACNELGLKLHVVGDGRDKEHLKTIAGPNIKFLGRVSDEELRGEYAGASAYIYPQKEDFGLMPVEAACAGTPTIAANVGGALETVIDGITGTFFEFHSKEDLKRVLSNWDKSRYNIENLRSHALQFNKETFTKKIEDIVQRI